MDQLLVDRGLAPTRTKAQALIMSGSVLVSGAEARKAGATVPLDSPIAIRAVARFVSRGGEKLEGALHDFALSPEGQVCLDVGASTGGFTDCLLQHGAKLVYAVDVGRGQLHQSLRKDPRVLNLERTHIVHLDAGLLDPQPTFTVVDAAFISLTKILPKIKELMVKGGTVLAMVKPQFEVGARHLRKGVVRSIELQLSAVDEVEKTAAGLGFRCLGRAAAKLKGPKGNQEYFLHLALQGEDVEKNG